MISLLLNYNKMMLQIFTDPWPWYIVGPAIGLMVPLLLFVLNKSFGVSSSLKHLCAMCTISNARFFKYDWKKETWNLVFVFGIVAYGHLKDKLPH